MKPLAPDLFARRFDDLLEIGRSKLPALAPDWTDHNAHDPGITLMELLAWVAEAQLYSLSRVRRDERAAYAALFGVSPAGTRPARGLLWPDPTDPAAPTKVGRADRVIRQDDVVNAIGADDPTYRPEYNVLFVPGDIRRLQTVLADGRVVDLTAINARGSPQFLPFGPNAGPRDVLEMDYECRDLGGLFPIPRSDADGARLVVGVRAGAALTVVPSDARTDGIASRLVVTLQCDRGRFELPVVADTSAAFMRTGVLVLDVSAVKGSPRRFSLSFSAAGGLARPPRLLGLQLNVLPIVQGRSIRERLCEDSPGTPDQSFDLLVAGLRFEQGMEPVQIEVLTGDHMTTWQRSDCLAKAGPDDTVFEIDAERARITFGNGINGRIPAEHAQISASYATCDGAGGSTARNRRWQVHGFQDTFGINPDPVTGGADATGLDDQRALARQRLEAERPIVSRADLVAAAQDLPLLEVARAWVARPNPLLPRTNVITLVVMRARETDAEPAQAPETSRWLDAIRRQLAPRMTLGTRLRVAAPAYVDFSIQASVVAVRGRNPEDVKQAVTKALQARLVLVKLGTNNPRDPGAPLAAYDVIGWIRGVDGVQSVSQLKLVRGADGKAVDTVTVTPSGLPRLGKVAVDVQRADSGSAP
jgi:predicted phage baseplate assembly protein